MKTRHSFNFLAEETGFDRRTVKRRLAAAGILDPARHSRAEILAALKPTEAAKRGRELAERKTFEEWRKLKLANDGKANSLISKSEVADIVRKLERKFAALLTQKLENEYPSVVAGLDVPAARIYGKKLNDQIRAEVRSWATAWGGK